MIRTYESICAQQRAWADQKGIKVDKDGYTLRLRDNLFQSLSPETEEEFKSGKGDELGAVMIGVKCKHYIPHRLSYSTFLNTGEIIMSMKSPVSVVHLKE